MYRITLICLDINESSIWHKQTGKTAVNITDTPQQAPAGKFALHHLYVNISTWISGGRHVKKSDREKSSEPSGVRVLPVSAIPDGHPR
jgi:hypothetical protein